MTNRQSNIIFYSVIFSIICAVLVNIYKPSYFDIFTQSKEQRLIKEAMNNDDYQQALDIYAQLALENSDDTLETTVLYEEIAKLHSLLGNRAEQKNYYLKSLDIKVKLKKIDIFSLAKTYFELASIFEQERDYRQAQDYYERSLHTRLGDIDAIKPEDQGMFLGMQQSRLNYLRLNSADTISTFKKLANIHRIKQEYKLAKQYYEKALAASILTFGEDDRRTLEIKNNKLIEIDSLLQN